MYVTHSLLSHFAEVINSIDEGTLSWLNSRSNNDVYDTSMNDYTRRTFQPFFYKPNFCCCLNYYYCFYLIFFCRNNVIYIWLKQINLNGGNKCNTAMCMFCISNSSGDHSLSLHWLAIACQDEVKYTRIEQTK